MKHVLVLLTTIASFTLTAAAPGQERAKVRTATPTAAAATRAYTIPGRTEAYESTTVFTRATGIVRERRFDIGDQVKADEVMAVIDAPEIDRAVESAQAAVDQAAARAENARLRAERVEALVESRAVSKEEADQRRAEAAETEAAVRVAKTELARLQEQQRFAVVRAPFAGVVAARNFNRGDRMRGDSSTAEGWLYRLVRLDQLRFVIAAPPELAMQLRPGATGQVRFGEFPGRTIAAKFFRASGVFDESSGTMRVELLIDNPDLAVPAGLTGAAVFELAPAGAWHVVPANTVILNGGQATLAVVESGKIRILPVTLGRNLGAGVEAQGAGLDARTQVVVNPNALLRAGDAVEVVAGTPKPAP